MIKKTFLIILLITIIPINVYADTFGGFFDFGPNFAYQILTNTSRFGGILNSSNVTVQQALETLSYITASNTTVRSTWIFTNGGLRIPNSTTLPGSCTAGDVYLDTNATAGQQFYACEGGSFVLQGDGGAGGGDSITVNTTAVTNADFDNSTPVAASGVNVTWQQDGGSPANISAYVIDASANGVTKGVSTYNATHFTSSSGNISLNSVLDLGAITSFEIPNGASPTVDAFGEMAGDNDLWAASRGSPVFYDGTAAVGLVGALVSDAPSNGQVPKWNTGGTITWEDDTSGGSPTLSSILAATAGNNIGNANLQQVWNWAITSNSISGFTYGESSASTGASGTTAVLRASTVTSSTATPLFLSNYGTGLSFRVDDVSGDSSPFSIDANGKVGIGTASQTADLDVVGLVRTRNFTGCSTLGTDSNGYLSCTSDVEPFWWPATSLLPLEPADSIPPPIKDAGTNIDQLTIDFDSTTDECRTVTFKVPSNVSTGGTVTFYASYYMASVTSGTVLWEFRHNSGVGDGVDPDVAVTTESASASTVPGTAGQQDMVSWTETVSNLGWAANDMVDGMFCRDPDADSAAGDAKAKGFGLDIPIL